MNEESDKKDYEISFLGKAEADKSSLIQAINQQGGEIFYEGPVEHIALSYKIKKETSAYFGYVHARISPDKTKALRDQLNSNSSLLRFLMITPPHEKPRKWAPKTATQKPILEEPQQGAERKKPESLPLSNEALEKKIEEILQ